MESTQRPLSAASSRPITPGGGMVAGVSEVNYEKLILLFTSAHSSELHDRHVGVVERVCRVNANGFAIRDLPYIETILRFVVGKVCEGKADLFAPCLCKLLKTLTLPFVRRTATDEFKMLNNISSMVNAVSQTFQMGVPREAQIAAAEMLAEFACAYGARPSVMDADADTPPPPQGPGPTPRQYHMNQGLLERSGGVQDTIRLGFASVFGEETSQGDPELQEALIRAALQFSYHEGNAPLMVNAGVIEVLCKSLAYDYTSAIVFHSLELAWNLLENAPVVDYLAEHDATREAFCKVLTDQLERLLKRGFRIADKELRNELLLVGQLLAGGDACAASLHSTGFVRLAVAAGISSLSGAGAALCARPHSPEMPCPEVELKPYHLTADAHDFEMKRLAWNAVGAMCAVEAARAEATRMGLMEGLLLYLDEMAGANLAVSRWTVAQQRDLTLQAMAVLYPLVPLAAEAFSNANGCYLLLRFISQKEHGEMRQAALRLLRTIAGHEDLRTELGEKGAITLALELFANGTSPEVVRQDCVAAVAALCRDHDANQSLFRRERGLTCLKHALTALRDADHTLPSAYAVAVLNCAWGAVANNRKNLARFLAAHGLDAMLDYLEVCNAYVYPVVLSCIGDIMENPKAHEFFRQWTSGADGRCAARLLLDIWRNEEKARDMVDDHGLLKNPARPLVGTVTERIEWIPSMDMAYTFQAPPKKNVMARMKEVVNGDTIIAKIFAVFSKLGFDTFSYLPARDESTLQTIEKYIKFKQGEVWQDITTDFEEELVRPTGTDRVRLQSGVRKAEMIATDVVYVQTGLHEKHVQNLEATNAKFYDTTMKLARDEAEAKVYKRSMSTLTMKERLEAKLKKEQMLRKSFQKEKTRENFTTLLGKDVYADAAEEHHGT